MTKRKLLRLSRITENREYDSVRTARKESDDRTRAFDILMIAQQHYNNMERFRKDRNRNKRYTYGDQWGDVITVDGIQMTEEQYIYNQGNIPLKNNLIRRLVRNVLGVYRAQTKEPTCTARDRDEQVLGDTMSNVLQYNMQLNQMKEIYARSMEEFLISGLIAHKKSFGWRGEKRDCWTDVVNPNNFFIDNNMKDFRGWDVGFIGEVHDVSFEDLCGEFATSPKEFKRLYDIYNKANVKENVVMNCESFGYAKTNATDFLYPTDNTLCRVIEVWRKERRAVWRCHDPNNGSLFKIVPNDYDEFVVKENNKRLKDGMEMGIPSEEIPLIKAEWAVEDYWYFYYISPLGDILKEGETPYEHKSHPYVFRMYPFIDGEIHSFVSDFIDQQRYTNRLVTLYDWIIRASAKGVLLVPEDCIPEHLTIEDFAETWSRFNGVIAIKAKPGVELPKQVAINSTNIGITELLNLQLKFFEDISGVNGALQGKPGYSGMSGSLYAQQTQNATTSLLDLLEAFSMFVVDAAYKDVKNIQQFYDSKRIFNIAGKNAFVEYDPRKIQDVDFDLSIVESTATPVYRQMANDFLMQIWNAGQITLQQLLEHGEFPFADELLQSLKSQQEMLEQGNNSIGLEPQMLSKVKENANMEAVDKAYNILRA